MLEGEKILEAASPTLSITYPLHTSWFRPYLAYTHIMALSSGKGDGQQVEHVTSSGSIHSHDGAKNKESAADVLHAQQIAAQWQNNTLEEKRLVRKLDFRILPCCWVLYLLGFLDRANIGFVQTIRTSLLGVSLILIYQQCEIRWSRDRFQVDLRPVLHHRARLLHLLPRLRSTRQHDSHPSPTERVPSRSWAALGNLCRADGRNSELGPTGRYEIPSRYR